MAAKGRSQEVGEKGGGCSDSEVTGLVPGRGLWSQKTVEGLGTPGKPERGDIKEN